MLHSPTAARAAPSTALPAVPPRLVPQRLSDRLAVLLGDQIEQGTLRPGDRLPTEAQLAAVHGVSRTVVREAMHQLKSRQLVVSRQGSGVFVEPPPLNRPLAFDPAVLDSVQAVVHAAGQDGVAEDLAFHRAIGQATGNPQFTLLLGFLEQYLREGMRITRGNEARRLDFMEAVRHEHRAIVDAIAARDPVLARRRAREHLQHSEQRLIEGGVIAKSRNKRSGK